MPANTQQADDGSRTWETTDLRYGKDAPGEDDPCEHSTHMGSPVIMTAVGDRDDPVREVKVCSACQTVLDDGKWQTGRGVVIEGEGRTLMRRTNVEQDTETSIRIPLADVLDDPAAQVTHVGVQDGDLVLKTQKQVQETLTSETSEDADP